MAISFLLLRHCAIPICLLTMAVVSSTSPFLPNTPGLEWKLVGSLDMTDPTQQCPDSWQTFTSPRTSCGKKSGEYCDSLNITTSGASYQTVCGRFRGYQKGSPDAFHKFNASIPINIETYYTVTYGAPGNRHHVFTYAAGYSELTQVYACPCTAAGYRAPSIVGSDYYCESGNPQPSTCGGLLLYSDV